MCDAFTLCLRGLVQEEIEQFMTFSQLPALRKDWSLLMISQSRCKLIVFCMQRSDQELANSQSVDVGESGTHTGPLLHATLCIERALHLTLPPSVTEATSDASMTAAARPGLEGQVAVACEWGGVAHATPAVALSRGGSATWQYHVALHVALHVARAEASCGRILEPAHLCLQVSCKSRV